MKSPREIVEERKRKDEAHLAESIKTIEELVDRDLFNSFDEAMGYALTLRKYSLRKLHKDAEDQVLKKFQNNGWHIYTSNKDNSFLLFIARCQTPPQQTAIFDELVEQENHPAKDWVEVR
jgi:hypothetical protein